MPADHYEIRHQANEQRFEALIDGQLARCDYRQDGDLMRIFHTEVPRALQGRGIAAALVEAAFRHAQRHQLRVQPQCSYVRVYLQRHPQWEFLRG
jgi:uncharacterized protein